MINTSLVSLLVLLAFNHSAFAQKKPEPKPSPMIPIDEVFEPAPPAHSELYGMVATVQWNSEKGTPVGPEVTAQVAEDYKMANRRELEALIRKAAAHGAKLIVTPEFGIPGYPDNKVGEFMGRKQVEPYVELIPGPSTNFFGKLAKELGVYIQIGFAEVDAKSKIYYNAAVVLNPEGQIEIAYRKMNLFTGEDRFLVAGDTPMVYQNRFFGRVAVMICADIYYKLLLMYYNLLHLDAVTLSSSWAQMNSGMKAFKEGATKMRTAVIASNNSYFPDAGVVNPDGSTQSWIRQSSGIAYGYLLLKPSKK